MVSFVRGVLGVSCLFLLISPLNFRLKNMADTFVKRSALALAACGLAMGAHAQSSVTLYGTVDAGVVYTTNQQTTPASTVP